MSEPLIKSVEMAKGKNSKAKEKNKNELMSKPIKTP